MTLLVSLEGSALEAAVEFACEAETGSTRYIGDIRLQQVENPGLPEPKISNASDTFEVIALVWHLGP